MIRVWQGFSCNNSSSFRLVARFRDPAAAADTARELTAFFTQHGRQLDELSLARDWTSNTAAAQALAARYGFTWDQVLAWSTGSPYHGNEPTVVAEDGVLVVHHPYCVGFGDALPVYLRERGGHVEPADIRTPMLSLVFALPAAANEELACDLDLVFSQLVGRSDRAPLRLPWLTGEDRYGPARGFRDERTVGLYVPFHPPDVAEIRAWLADHRVVEVAFRLCEDDDGATFTAIASARCTACDAGLDYLDPRLHDIETPQLVCRACGGLYDLATFTGGLA